MNNYKRFTVGGDVEQSAGTDGTDGRESDGANGIGVERTNGDLARGERPMERTLPLDQTFEILKNQRRRYVLRYLNTADGPVSLSELAEQIAAWENEKEVRQITSSERKRVYVGLYQCHLPKMAAMDIISFNKPRGVVERNENADWFDSYLQSDGTKGRRSWNPYHVGLVVLGISLLPVTVSLLTEAMIPLVATILFVTVLTLGTVFRLAREDATEHTIP